MRTETEIKNAYELAIKFVKENFSMYDDEKKRITILAIMKMILKSE